MLDLLLAGLGALSSWQADVPRDDVRVGSMAVTSPQTHTHPYPEILYVVDGTLEWTQGAEQSTLGAGHVVVAPRGTAHSLTPRASAHVIYFRWAPDGDLSTLHRGSTMTERVTPVRTPAAELEPIAPRRYESGPMSGVRSTTHIDDIEWTTNFTYSDELWKVYRYKPLVRASLADWRGVARADVRMGLQELDPGAAYPTHHHPSPEIYVVVSGGARWSVEDRTIDAEAGTQIYTPPDSRHRIENTGETRLRWLYFWWAPNGDRSVFDRLE